MWVKSTKWINLGANGMVTIEGAVHQVVGRYDVYLEHTASLLWGYEPQPMRLSISRRHVNVD